MSRNADVEFSAELTLNDVFADLDRLDARVEESKRKAKTISASDPRSSGVSAQAELAAHRASLAQQVAVERAAQQERVVNSRAAAAQLVAASRARFAQETALQRAGLQQQAAADRTANQRELVDARATASERVATKRAALQQENAAQRAGFAQALAAARGANQQRLAADRAAHQRELAEQRTSSQQQTAAYRAGLQQQTIALRQEGSQRLAVLRSMLRRQEIELKASVGGYSSTASSIGNYLTKGFGQAIAMIAGGNLIASAIVGTFHALAGAVQVAGRALEAFVSTGLSFAQTLETAQRAIAALIQANYTLKDSLGNTLSSYEAFNAASRLSTGVLEQLRVAALKTPLTFEELALGLQQTAALAGEAGIKVEELVPLTVALSSAVKTLGLDARQVQQEVRGVLSGRVGPSEQLARTLGLTADMVKNWKAQGTLVAELTKKLEPFNLALEQSMDHADVLLSTLQDIGLNFSRVSTEGLFEGLKKAGAILRDGLIDPISGELRPELNGASKVLNDISERFGKIAQIVASHIVAAVRTVADWLIEHRKEIDKIGELTETLIMTVGRLLYEISQTLATIFGLNKKSSDEYAQHGTLLGGVQQMLFSIETIARVIEGIFHGINVVTNSWVGSIISALNPLTQIGNLIARAKAMMGGSGGNNGAMGNVFGTGPKVGGVGGFQFNQGGFQFSKPNSGFAPTPNPRVGGGGGGGGGRGGGSRPDNQGPQVLAQLRDQNALLAEAEGYDRSMLRLEQEQSKELKRIVALQKDKKISAVDAAAANKLIAEQMAFQTAELDKQRNDNYASVQQDLNIRRLELGQDEIGLIRFKDQIENDALRKRLERELGLGEQQRINSLVWRDSKIREEVLQKKLDDTRLAAQKEMIELVDREREKRLQMFAEWQEQSQAQIEAFSASDFGNRGAILEQLEGIRGLDDFDIPGIAEELAGLGLTVETLGDKFGHVATNVRDMRNQLEAVQRFGPLMLEFIGSMQEAAEQALETAKQLTVNFIPNVFTAIGEALGGALAGVEDFGAAMKKAMFGLLGELASAWGRYFILLGVGNFLFNPALGAAQIAAGVALTALGAFLTAKGQASAQAASSAPAAGASNASDIGEEREKRIRRRSFNTSGESEERRPLGLFGGGSGGGDNRLEVEVTFQSTGNAVMDKLIVDHGIVTVKGLGRGSVRQAVKKRIA